MDNNFQRKKILTALDLVLQDEIFIVAPKSSAFLRYVVMQTLDGNIDRIKAYSIAIDAIGKPSEFDPQNDPTIRILAKRVRDSLSDYYRRTADHKVILKFKPGSYTPQFFMPAGD